MAPDLVRQYVVCDSDSDDGVTFIKLFIQELELALSEKTLAVRMSHGNWLSLRFDLPARHRRKGISEVLHLLVLLGPCASNETSIYVLRTSRALPIDEPPF